MTESMKLTPLERWMVSNQLRILEALYPEEAEDHAVQREAIERGYEFAYNIYLDYDVMTEAEGQEVWDTLDMFRAIDYSITHLNTDEFETHLRRKFIGYDGNNESKFMAFASYTVERLKRWTDLPLEKYYNFNSHCPMRCTYKKMLIEWKNIPPEERFRMNQGQVKKVLDSANPDTQ